MNKRNIIFGLVIILLSMVGSYISTSFALAESNYPIHSENVEYTDNSNLGVTQVQAAIDGTCTKFNTQLTTLESTIIDKIYPVGSIYISETDDTVSDVESRFGGTWIAYGAGKTLIGAGTGTDSNGNTQTFTVSNNSSNLGEYIHKLTKNELPNISGNIVTGSGSTGSTAGGYGVFRESSGIFSLSVVKQYGQPTEGYMSKFANTYDAYSNVSIDFGLDEGHNNIQPYVTVYMYQRTA